MAGLQHCQGHRCCPQVQNYSQHSASGYDDAKVPYELNMTITCNAYAAILLARPMPRPSCCRYMMTPGLFCCMYPIAICSWPAQSHFREPSTSALQEKFLVTDSSDGDVRLHCVELYVSVAGTWLRLASQQMMGTVGALWCLPDVKQASCTRTGTCGMAHRSALCTVFSPPCACVLETSTAAISQRR